MLDIVTVDGANHALYRRAHRRLTPEPNLGGYQYCDVTSAARRVACDSPKPVSGEGPLELPCWLSRTGPLRPLTQNRLIEQLIQPTTGFRS